MDEVKSWKVVVFAMAVALIVGIITGYGIKSRSWESRGTQAVPENLLGRLSVVEAYLNDLQSDLGAIQDELSRIGEIHSRLVAIESGLREIKSGIDQQTHLGDQAVGELNDIIQRIEGGYSPAD